MADRAADGRQITEQMVWRAERYQIVKGQLEEQIKQYNQAYAVQTISRAQEGYALLGIDAAQAAIISQYGPMGRYFTRINLGAVQSMIGFAGDGSPLYKLLKESYPDATDGLIKALVNGLARGQGSAQTAQDMVNGMGMGLERALLIARTETARAYRTGSTEQYRESGVVHGFMRLVKKETACLACLMLDGQKFATEDELDDHPRGKCQVVPMVDGVGDPQWEKGEQWFKGLPADQQRAMMGDARYEAWKDGRFDLKDLAKTTHNSTWGDSPRVATLDELARISNITNKPDFYSIITDARSDVLKEFPEIKDFVKKEIDFTQVISGAEYDFDTKSIRLPSYLKNKTNAELMNSYADIDQTIRHELGHAIQYKITTGLTETEFAAYKNTINDLISKLGYPTEYAKKNLREWVSERFSLESQGKLKKKLTPVLKGYLRR